MTNLKWEPLEDTFDSSETKPGWRTYRAKVTDGWLVEVRSTSEQRVPVAQTFVPDPQRVWFR